MPFLSLLKLLMYPATSFKYNVDNCLTRIDTDDLRKNIKSSKLYSSLCLNHRSCYSVMNIEKSIQVLGTILKTSPPLDPMQSY